MFANVTCVSSLKYHIVEKRYENSDKCYVHDKVAFVYNTFQTNQNICLVKHSFYWNFAFLVENYQFMSTEYDISWDMRMTLNSTLGEKVFIHFLIHDF